MLDTHALLHKRSIGAQDAPHALPLVTACHIYEYNSCAKGCEQPTAEVPYFLSRTLELLALGEELHHMAEEKRMHCLQRNAENSVSIKI